MPVAVRLLGPLELRCGDRPVLIGAAKERLILVLLALNKEQVVSAERLVDALWDADPPPSAGASLRVLISRLRKTLAAAGCGDVIRARAPGYVLVGEELDVDVHRFESLTAQGARQLEAGSSHEAAATLRAALALWHGDRLAESSETRLGGEAARLGEARLAAVQARIDADLACGRHAELIGELHQLCREHPLRERLWAQHMLALYRCGRQADALAVAQQLRTTLADELGLDPNSELRRLEAAILGQDPAIALPPRPRATRVWKAPARNPWFTGRAGVLGELHRRLRAGRPELMVQTLHGLGGVGKTQLALEYAHRYAADYDVVWWIDAARPVLISDQLTRLAARLGIPPGATAADTVERLLAELRVRDRLLLVFDNAERPEDVAGYRPGGTAHVLITSRFPGWGGLGGRLEIDVLDRPETVALLQARIPALDATLALELAAELGDLPLAAAQAAGYLEQTGLPGADYLRHFRSRRADLLARGDVVGYAGRIDTTWALSVERLQADEPAAVQLLQLAAFLAPEPIPLALFGHRPELLDEPLRSIAADTDALTDTVGALVRYSLARRHPESFQIHRLVQAVIRHRLDADGQQATTERAVALLAAAAPGDPESPANWPTYVQLAPHALTTAPVAGQSAAGRQLLVDTARYLDARGDSSGSRAVSEQQLDPWRRSLGRDHPDTLSAASTLTRALATLAEAEPACALGQDTLQRCRRVLGADHPTTLVTAAALCLTLVQLGQAQQAATLGEDTLERCGRVFGPENSITLWTAGALIQALLSAGRTQQACALGQDTLQHCRTVFSHDHATTLVVSGGLSHALVQLGQAQQARTLSEDTLHRSRRMHGPDHPTTLVAAAALAHALTALGETEPARALAHDTLQRGLRRLGPDHLVTLLAAATLSFAVALLGDPDSARTLAEDTLRRCRHALGPEHSITLWAAATLALALMSLGHAEPARVLGEDTLHCCGRVLGQDHATSLVAGVAVTGALDQLGKVRDARALRHDMLRRCRRVLTPTHPLMPILMQTPPKPASCHGAQE
jgi:DNA-binding SARP family transcriptional activator